MTSMGAYQEPSETKVNVAIAQCPAIMGPTIGLVEKLDNPASCTCSYAPYRSDTNAAANPCQQCITSTGQFCNVFSTLFIDL